MEAYSIVGGAPLCGEAAVYGAKNAVLPLMAACMLVRGQIKLSGCPDLSDVRSMSRVLESFGCKAAGADRGFRRRGRGRHARDALQENALLDFSAGTGARALRTGGFHLSRRVRDRASAHRSAFAGPAGARRAD